MRNRWAFVVLAASFLALTTPCGVRWQSVGASSDGGCRGRPGSFTVPPGFRAARFSVEAMSPGNPCSGAGRAELLGFSIRSGGATIFLCSQNPSGALLCDPVPIEELVLGPGPYDLHSAPAAGSQVRLRYELRPES